MATIFGLENTACVATKFGLAKTVCEATNCGLANKVCVAAEALLVRTAALWAITQESQARRRKTPRDCLGPSRCVSMAFRGVDGVNAHQFHAALVSKFLRPLRSAGTRGPRKP